MKSYSDIGDAVLRLIPAHFPSDAAFERAAGLPPKTVSNWRRAKSATYMKMLPKLEDLLGEELSFFIHGTAAEDSGMTRDEIRLLRAWRSTEALPAEARRALFNTLTNMMKLSVGGKNK